jgi:hypothetical protein
MLIVAYWIVTVTLTVVNPLTPSDLQRRRAMNRLKIKNPSKKFRHAALRGGI